MSEDPKLYVRDIRDGKSPDDWTFEKHPDEAEINLFRYCGNDPVNFVDPMGLLTLVFDGSFPDSAKAIVKKAEDLLNKTQRGKQLLDADPKRYIIIKPTDLVNRTKSKGNVIYLNPKDPAFLDPNSRRDFSRYPSELPPSNDKGRAVTLGHELGHAVPPHPDDENYHHVNNHNVRDNENPIRRALGLPDRESVFRYPCPLIMKLIVLLSALALLSCAGDTPRLSSRSIVGERQAVSIAEAELARRKLPLPRRFKATMKEGFAFHEGPRRTVYIVSILSSDTARREPLYEVIVNPRTGAVEDVSDTRVVDPVDAH
jgi:hypothetical protein